MGAKGRRNGRRVSQLAFMFFLDWVLSPALACLLDCCLLWVTLGVPEGEGYATKGWTASPTAHLPLLTSQR